MSKFKIAYDNSAETIPMALGISKERSDELQFRADTIIHDMFRPRRVGDEDDGYPNDHILKQFISNAETQQEAIWLAYIAGCYNTAIDSEPIEDEKGFIDGLDD